ncbi:MAG TPA: Rieske 2Fe-2S domain-containing protein [Bacteroidia bacterium]|nr:Rieske 2Fe-2S domain-containing protein [Bacteroidia bacterium]
MLFERKIKWYKVFESKTAADQQLGLNTAQTILVKGKKICFARTAQGLFAVNDKCPHNGASLGNGYCTIENTIVCPLHRYSFDLKTGRAKSGLGDVVNTYPVEVKEDGVYVGLKEIYWELF